MAEKTNKRFTYNRKNGGNKNIGYYVAEVPTQKAGNRSCNTYNHIPG